MVCDTGPIGDALHLMQIRGPDRARYAATKIAASRNMVRRKADHGFAASGKG
jgi:hypothetical protein